MDKRNKDRDDSLRSLPAPETKSAPPVSPLPPQKPAFENQMTTERNAETGLQADRDTTRPQQQTALPADASPAQEVQAGFVGVTQQDVLAMVLASVGQATASTPRPSRVLCSELVDLAWTGLDGCLERTVANMEEIWRTGATVDAERPLPDGAIVTIRIGPEELQARVLYCQQNLTGYTVGVQFSGASEWSPERYLPSHALELGSLGREPSSVRPDDQDKSGNSVRQSLFDRSDGMRGHRSNGSAHALVRTFSLESLAPLIARGSMVALGQQMHVKQPV